MKLSEQAYRAFKAHLFAKDLRPGQFVSQRELVSLTGVPLGPMREALQKLEAEGLVEMIPQRGIRLAEANPKLIRDAFGLRILIETAAARHFAAVASDAAIAELDAAHRKIVAKAASGIDDTLLEAAQAVDWQLHDALVASLDNALIWNIHKSNCDRIRLIRLDSGMLTPPSLMDAMGEHLAVIDACQNREADDAAQAIEAHLATAMRRAMGL